MKKLKSKSEINAQRAYDRVLAKLRENDSAKVDEKRDYCDHKNQRGSQFKSKFCPLCGSQIAWSADEIAATKVKGDEDKVNESLVRKQSRKNDTKNVLASMRHASGKKQ